MTPENRKWTVDSAFATAGCDASFACLDKIYIAADSIRFTEGKVGHLRLDPIYEGSEIYLDIAVPFDRLDPCLKPNSILRNLARMP